MSYKVNWEENGVWIWHGGTVTSKEIFDSNMEFYGNPKSDKALYQLIDFLEVENIILSELTSEKIAYLDAAQSKSTPNIKVALVGTLLSAKKLFHEYIEHSSTITTNWSFEIFDDMQSARKWVTS